MNINFADKTKNAFKIFQAKVVIYNFIFNQSWLILAIVDTRQ